MIDPALCALTKAWITTVIASALLAVALALAPVWNSAAYLSALPAALRLASIDPDPLHGMRAAAALGMGATLDRYAARAGHTGS